MSRVEVYTDGSFRGGKCGIGVYFDKLDWEFSRPLDGRIKNIGIAELEAIKFALCIIKKHCLTRTEIYIYSDSKYAVNALTIWHPRWRKTGWMSCKQQPIKNKELIESILDILKNLNVKLFHVKGHTGNFGNEKANTLAMLHTKRIN